MKSFYLSSMYHYFKGSGHTNSFKQVCLMMNCDESDLYIELVSDVECIFVKQK